ncbi:hypothetical protein FRZ03_06880 [Streptomyces misionensis]|uniref:Uncharacterized protein n=1 Tax=Streptomyces misionensis TaxID=67331 RepID=A0A5C6JZD8_9ACTN|nr:hypothetical protein [Streptomyces misionensis]TWV55683.1 hypothetical protein FRZ03_06880 [Streptomyces misionensis]
MGRVGSRFARFQVSTRLTWSFSARAGLGRARSRRRGPVFPASLPMSSALLRSALRTLRPRAPLPRARRRQRP